MILQLQSQYKNIISALFIDIKGAFDNVSKVYLLQRMLKLECVKII
jgi:hypothetical protein